MSSLKRLLLALTVFCFVVSACEVPAPCNLVAVSLAIQTPDPNL